jgi:UDP-GlcNAc:undecaprenyl-phosphate GlcNAc-1-phosphate transferase
MSITATQFALLGVAAFALTGLLTWPIRALAIRLGAMDHPNLDRKSQTAPVPYLGGIAIALGISITTAAAVLISNANHSTTSETNTQQTTIRLAAQIILPALALGAMGLYDDLKSLPAWPRLLTQTLVGTALALFIINTGTQGTAFASPTINTAITIFWIVGICNSINFFDNLDGAASGTAAIAALGIFVIAFDRGQELVSALSIVTAGATIGFLMWNKSPAKIYMGDAGALFLGVIFSVLTIRLNPAITPTWKSLTIPVILLAVPLLDTTTAVISRLSRKFSPLTGGKDHLSHRLVRSGLTRRQAALALWSASGICALTAITVYKYPNTPATILITTFALTWLLALALFLRTPATD